MRLLGVVLLCFVMTHAQTPCPINTYATSNGTCMNCAPNSWSHAGSTICLCNIGYIPTINQLSQILTSYFFSAAGSLDVPQVICPST